MPAKHQRQDFLERDDGGEYRRLEMPMPNCGQNNHWQPVAVLLSQTKSVRFVRRLSKGATLHKVTASFSREWLDDIVGPELSGQDVATLNEFCGCHLAMRTWAPSKMAVSLVEQILKPPQMSPVARKLYLDSRALLQVGEALDVLLHDARTSRIGSLRLLDRQRLVALDAFLASYEGGPVSAENLARQSGASANTLRRLVQFAHGQSLTEYVRRWRLERTRAALEAGDVTIVEAARLAGYESAANFSTAIRRQFGTSPRKVQIYVQSICITEHHSRHR